MTQPTCDACKTAMPISNLLLSWPGWIVCRRCRASNTVRHGHALGVVYVGGIFAVLVSVLWLARGLAPAVEGAPAHPLQVVLELAAPLVAIAVVGSLYAYAVRRWLPLRAKARPAGR